MINHNTDIILKSLEKAIDDNNISLWRELLLQNKSSLGPASLSYNLGLSYLYEGDGPMARYHFIQAQFLLHQGIKTKELLHLEKKLEIAHRFIETHLCTTPQIEHEVWMIKNAFLFGKVSCALLTLCVLIALGRRIKEGSFIRRNAILFFLLILPYFCYQIFFNNLNSAIILRPFTAQQSPTFLSHGIYIHHMGERVLLRDFKKHWVFIELPFQWRGWAERDKFGILPESL